MDTIDIIDIVYKNVDVQRINQELDNRKTVLGAEMNEEARNQYLSEVNNLVCNLKKDGSSLLFELNESESYLLDYLKSHGTPVAGGDNGTAHNVDGSTYQSNVPKQLWGTPLPELELPHLDVNEELYHIVELMAPDAIQSALSQSKPEIKEQVAIPYIKQQVAEIARGD